MKRITSHIPSKLYNEKIKVLSLESCGTNTRSIEIKFKITDFSSNDIQILKHFINHIQNKNNDIYNIHLLHSNHNINLYNHKEIQLLLNSIIVKYNNIYIPINYIN
jgi:hypothetical protein